MAPIAFIPWAHVQIDRRRQYAAVKLYADDRRALDEPRSRCIAEIEVCSFARNKLLFSSHLCDTEQSDADGM
jgi:hypothetical protein